MSLDIIKWIKGWRLDKFFHNFKKNALNVAISITEAVKTTSEGALFTTLATVIDEALKTHVASDVLSIIHSASLKLLAAELAVEGLPDNPTEADILEFEKRVFEAISGQSTFGQSKLWTTFASQMYGIIQERLATDTDGKYTFAEIVEDIEKAYQQFVKDKADAEAEG